MKQTNRAGVSAANLLARTPAPPAPVQMRMDCPDCGAGIELSLPSLLLGKPVWCGGCGAKLEVDLAASMPALERLRDGLAKLETIRAESARVGSAVRR